MILSGLEVAAECFTVSQAEKERRDPELKALR